MFIADAHCDTLHQLAIGNRALADCTVTPERMQRGGLCLQTYAMFAGAKGPAGTPYSDGKKMLAKSGELGVEILRGQLPDAFPTRPTGVLSVEGGELFAGDLNKLAEFDDDSRLRAVALTWSWENEIGYPGSSGSEKGLKPFGRELVAEMDRRGILTDVSHLNDAGFWDVVKLSALPPIATHSNLRWLCDVSRNLTREMAQAIIDRGGFIGMNFYSTFLVKDGTPTIDDVVRHIDALMEMGGEDTLGFGSDFDGISAWPEGLGNPADFPNLIDALRRRGYTEAQIEKIAWKNYWRVLKQAEKQRA
ncbi:MAG: membrane dipeptidase [Candidatus Faecivicinus sp.]|nr:membrane dipeptidase [Candidatus Faecivicinus sp.]